MISDKLVGARPVRKPFRSSNLGILIILVGLCTMLSFLSKDFLTASNLLNVLRQCSPASLLALGQLLVILTGGIDLSVGSVAAFTSVIAAMIMVRGYNGVLAMTLACCVGILLGASNGLLVARGRIPPFIASLGIMSISRGITYIVTKGIPVYGISDRYFRSLGLGYIGGIPFPVILVVCLFLVVGFVLRRTRTGRYIYAVGSNSEAARMSGVSVARTQMVVYVLSGLLATVGGLIVSSRLNAGVPQSGYGDELDSIAAVVIGGASLAGGRGFVSGTAIGVLIVGVVRNGLNLLNVYPYWQNVVVGGVIVIAALIERVTKWER